MFALAVRFVVCVIVLFVGLGIANFLVASREKAPRSERTEPVISVRTVIAQSRPTARWWEGFGTARALRESRVSAEVSAVVVRRPADIEAGMPVDAGQLLVELDARDFEQAAERTRQLIAATEADLRGLDVELESAQDRFDASTRTVELFDQEIADLRAALERNGARRIEIDRLERSRAAAVIERERLREVVGLIPTRRARLEAELSRLNSDLATAELDIERCRVVAPFAGTLQEVSAEVGERVSPGQQIAVIVNASKIEVPLRVPASAALEVDIGGNAELWDTTATTWREATIARIAPAADAASRTIAMFAEVEQSPTNAWLTPGQFVRGRVASGSSTEHVLVPRSAVDEGRVLIVEIVDGDDRVFPRSVSLLYYIEDAIPEIHPTETQWAVLGGGVQEGERIVVSLPEAIAANTRVTATDAARLLAKDPSRADDSAEASP